MRTLGIASLALVLLAQSSGAPEGEKKTGLQDIYTLIMSLLSLSC